MKLLYYSPASYGGIADYAHEQANALVESGVDVTFLCSPKYPSDRGEKYRIVPTLSDIVPSKPIHNRLLKRAYFAYTILKNSFILADFIKKNHFQYVLSNYSEYLAPLWSWRLKRLAKKGVVFGAIVHYPVSDFVVGPRWWHRWSIACGYSFLRKAFVHGEVEIDTVKSMPNLETYMIPYGIHNFPVATKSKQEIRNELKLPLDAKVVLAFGHIRDNKNLDLFIRAMKDFPQLYLLVAGKEQSDGQRPASYYQALAESIGVNKRCRWKIDFIQETEIGNLFEAADMHLLTYNKTFHSGSAALGTAIRYHKISLASAGEGPMRHTIQRYGLGIWVEPDNLEAIIEGIKKWLTTPLRPQFEQYIKDNSWQNNAQIIFEKLKV
jgi:glycosyltransferase involved in cell wall biosynthesis